MKIYESDQYEDFIISIFRKIPYVRTKALGNAICNYFKNISFEGAKAIMREEQEKGCIVQTEDGWSLTKGQLIKIMDEKPILRYAEQYRYGSIAQYEDQLSKEFSACFFLVADMMPFSENFCVGTEPWAFAFDMPAMDDKPSRFYQLTYIPADTEDLKIEEIRCSAQVLPSEDIRDSYRRIAVVENEQHAWKVPYLGFVFVCALDMKEKSGYRVVEDRSQDEDIWKDAK